MSREGDTVTQFSELKVFVECSFGAARQRSRYLRDGRRDGGKLRCSRRRPRQVAEAAALTTRPLLLPFLTPFRRRLLFFSARFAKSSRFTASAGFARSGIIEARGRPPRSSGTAGFTSTHLLKKALPVVPAPDCCYKCGQNLTKKKEQIYGI